MLYFNITFEVAMHTANLRKVGGSVMLAVPPAILELLDLEAGATVGITVEGERLVIQPQNRPRYTLDELLKQCDAHARVTKKDRAWIDLAPAGREL
jgi:antitoxin ChpS